MGLLGALFGGSKSNQSSDSHQWNNAWPGLNTALSPVVNAVGTANNWIQKLLGGDSSGFDAYKNATGYDFANNQGVNGIMTNMRAQGLGNSGAALKSIARFGTNLQSQYAGDYLKTLLGLGQMGNQSAGILSDAGREGTSHSEGSSIDYGKGILGTLASFGKGG